MNRLETSPKPSGQPKDNGHAKSDIATSADVAEAVVQGMEEERFLILPHKEVERFFRNKSRDYDGWIGKLGKNAAQLTSPDVITKDSES